MAVKTITVTENAYDAMKRLKGADESFSELFIRIGKKQLTVDGIAGILKHTPEEAQAFRERVRAVHEGLNAGFKRRAADVRARLKRIH